MALMMNKLAAELIGTFWLVFGGCGSAVLAAVFPEVGIGLLGVSFAFGLTGLTRLSQPTSRNAEFSRFTLREEDIERLYGMVAVGAPVYIY